MASLLETLHERLELIEPETGKLLFEILFETSIEIQKLRVLTSHLLHHLEEINSRCQLCTWAQYYKTLHDCK